MAVEIPSVEDLLKKGIASFKEKFQSVPELAGIAPGRVNLIGEHTDYNEGFVFPMALPMVAIVLGKRTNENKCKILTTNKHADDSQYVEFSLPTDLEPLKPGKPNWANYIKGVVQYFDGPKVGFNAVVISSVPPGSGLSSSAALEVATYTFLEGLVGHKTDTKQKASLCQKAEHNFASVPCGVMDQLISVHGEESCVTLIDCRSLHIMNVTIPASNCVFLIVNSNVHHELASSEYSVRRQTCEEVAKKFNRKSLRDVTLVELNKLKSSNNIDDEMYRRARHVITENERTLKAVEALKSNSIKEFGHLMNESHNSLSKDYEVSCEELDFLVQTAREVDGVYGSRMTGGGFGGCTVTLVDKSSVNAVIKRISDSYKKQADFFVVKPSPGARVMSLTS
ncbi:hypothetical protein V9T40_008391 [Parthenolecanium corni]|uniref:Galactokinase n=1 Tax=Parthenolecanium corni TaxID=536013 RepID=A0AAN9Y815_9HEMI